MNPRITFQYDGRTVVFFRAAVKDEKPEDVAKFRRLAKLTKGWKSYEKRLLKDLSNGSREAYVCLLMAHYGVRMGNADSATGYTALMKHVEGQHIQTYGGTTLLKEHVEVAGTTLVLSFLGKKAVDQKVVVTHKELVKWGKVFLRDTDTPKFLNTTEYFVRRYLKAIDDELIVKDFRGLCANAHAYMMFQDEYAGRERLATKTAVNGDVKALCEQLAKFMGNTAGVCKRSYLSPKFIEHVIEQRWDK